MSVTFEIPRTLEVGLVSLDQKDLMPISQALKKVGLQNITMFTELEKAIEFAKGSKNALLILDVRSQLDLGLEYLKDLKVDSECQNFPVIPVVKAGEQTAVLTLLRDYGVNDAVAMPLQTSSLVQAISRTLASFLPGEIEASIRAVRAAIAAERFDAAASVLSRLSERRKTIRTELGLSHVSLAQNDLDGSRNFLGRAKGMDPASFGVQLAVLKQLLRERSAVGEIEECIQSMLSRLSPPGRIAQILKAFYRSGRFADGLGLSVSYEKDFSVDPSLKLWQAKLALKCDRLDSALQLLQKFHSSGQRTFESLNMLGVINKRKGKLDVAVRAFEEAREMNPGDYRIHFNLGMSFEEMGNEPKALEAYQSACEIAPDFEKSKHRLAVLIAKRRAA
jgi:tetratricopeptide (TPR) repeat protein